MVALVYLLCILAPTISFALPGSQAVAPCLIDASHARAVAHVHDEVPAQHVHKDAQMRGDVGAYSHVNSGDDYSISSALDGTSVPAKAPHSSDAKCCGLMCVTALPATLIDIVKPGAPAAVCEVEGSRKATDNAPPSHYRPPIS